MKSYIIILLAIIVTLSSCRETKILPTEQYYSIQKPIFGDSFYSARFTESTSLRVKEVIKDGGTQNILQYGYCWGENSNPTLKDSHQLVTTKIDTIPFSFQSRIENLKPNTNYNINGFAITAKDTVYTSVTTAVRTYGSKQWAERESFPVAEILKINFTTGINDKSTTFFNDDKFYNLYYNETDMNEYDSKNYTWTRKAIIPAVNTNIIQKYAFFTNNRGYCGNIYDKNGTPIHEFFEYDIRLNSWKKIADAPIDFLGKGFGFNDNKYGYYLNVLNDKTELWQFDPNSLSWLKIKEYSKIGGGIIKLFYNKDRAFILTVDNTIFTLNPTNYVWEIVTATPLYTGKPNPLVFPVYVNSKIYLGRKDKTSINSEFWEYDTINKNWTKLPAVETQQKLLNISEIQFSQTNSKIFLPTSFYWGYVGTDLTFALLLYEYIE